MYITLRLCISLLLIEICTGTTRPLSTFATYQHSTELQKNVADLWWTVNEVKKEITFELHIKTTGWVALGISPAGGMSGADIAVGWVDCSRKVFLQDRHAFNNSRPIIDNTTQDWFALQGREEDGWTTIQFKRFLDTCDSMGFPIKSGTNVVIFAYGLVDLDLCRPELDIMYHDTRRDTRIIPLQSYADPPMEEKFADLEWFEFRSNDYVIPSTDTTYHCKVYKAPSGYPVKRHAIAQKTLFDPRNIGFLHHLDLCECDSTAIFDDNKLPDGLCDQIADKVTLCSYNLLSAWSIGADILREFPDEAGYGIGDDYEIKYYMLQIHYDNPRLNTDRFDSTGIRFYLGKELRQYDLGFLSFGTGAGPNSLAIPPRVNRFMIDSYCPSEASRNFPASGITVVFALLHTHLQGYSVWTKVIRNDTAVGYLFNAEQYNFNYQFDNRLPKPIKLYPGDAFATRCVYNTINKDSITLGGERTKDEMCIHMFAYYPRMDNLYSCLTMNEDLAWQTIMNTSTPFDFAELKQWLLNRTWTPESTGQWQEFYNTASRQVIYGRSEHMQELVLPILPTYEDLKPEICNKKEPLGTDAMPLFNFLNSSNIKLNFITHPFTVKQYIVTNLNPLTVKAEVHIESTGGNAGIVFFIEGYVCGNYFNDISAETACRSLGYTTTTATAVPIPSSSIKATCSLEHESWLKATMLCGDIAMISNCPIDSTNLVQCGSSVLFNHTCLYYVAVDC